MSKTINLSKPVSVTSLRMADGTQSGSTNAHDKLTPLKRDCSCGPKVMHLSKKITVSNTISSSECGDCLQICVSKTHGCVFSDQLLHVGNT